MSGGEPLLHPDLDEIVSHIRRRGAIATLITNGYLLTRDRIERLNRAGLDHLQISIDNVMPDEVSKKSLKVLDQKLPGLAEHAEFDVTVNVVVGSGVCESGGCAGHRAARRRARVFHDGRASFTTPAVRWCRSTKSSGRSSETVVGLAASLLDFANYNRFQKNLSEGQPNDWQCHAGARYLYVCEDGLVHWCSQQRGYPGIPLEQYSREDLEREYQHGQDLRAVLHGGLRPSRRAGGRIARGPARHARAVVRGAGPRAAASSPAARQDPEVGVCHESRTRAVSEGRGGHVRRHAAELRSIPCEGSRS